MARQPLRLVTHACVLLIVCAGIARAQTHSSIAGDRARLAEITGDTVPVRSGCRPVASVFPHDAFRLLSSLGVCVIAPSVRTTYNSQIPYSLDDGPLWAGRGWNTSITAGLAGTRAMGGAVVTARAAPTLVYSQNLPFQVIPASISGRSSYANPFHPVTASIDMPLRFGDRHLLGVDPGRSSVEVRGSRVMGGITSENEWWGPAIRNSLVMSDHGPGIPRLYVATASPWHSRAGDVHAKLISGLLTESLFFDSDPGNDYRSISGALVTLRPALDTTLTLGLSRVVFSPLRGHAPLGGALAHAADVLIRWQGITNAADTSASGVSTQDSDQIMSVFFRWVFQQAGFEFYGEWARLDLPRSGNELLVAARHTGGYTLGFQLARRRRQHDRLRLQAEVTDLEQNLVFPDRPPMDFYTGRAAVQGYTQRGQVVGAAIGPGASSQFIAVDYIAPLWQAGAYIGRIRWENDALYRQSIPTLFSHDVSLLGGVRGAYRTPWTDIAMDATLAYRYNYLFQNGFANPGGFGFRTVDMHNLTVTTTITPR